MSGEIRNCRQYRFLHDHFPACDVLCKPLPILVVWVALGQCVSET